MSDGEKLVQISEYLKKMRLVDMTEEEFFADCENDSDSDLKSRLWDLYCFALDVRDVINCGGESE